MLTKLNEPWGYLQDNEPLSKLEQSLAQMIHEPHGIYQPVSNDTVLVEYHCNKCNGINKLQLDFTENVPLRDGCMPFPQDNQLCCQYCNTHHNVSELHKDAALQFNHVTENA